jgi:hypothetical protein
MGVGVVACAGGEVKTPAGDTDLWDTDGGAGDSDVAGADTDTGLFAETGLFDTDAPSDTDTAQPTDTDLPTATSLAVGDLVLTEVMIEPSLSDCATMAYGQYVELKNATDHVVNLQGLVLRYGARTHVVTERALLQPGAYAVGRPDTTACAGYPPSFLSDFTYSTLVVLMAQGSDTTVRLQRPDSVLVDSVDYGRWELGGSAVRVLPGHAAQLKAGAEDATSNDAPDGWCSADEALGTSLPVEEATFGTPGRQAQGCASAPAP